MFDKHCPAPPPPYDPCKAIGPHARAQAEAICNSLRGTQKYFVSDQIIVDRDTINRIVASNSKVTKI